MAASVAPNMPQPRARVDTYVHHCMLCRSCGRVADVTVNALLPSVSAEQSALSMPMPEMHASPAPQQEEQQPQQLQQQEPLAHSTIVGEADAIPVVAGSVAIDPAPAPVAGAKVTASKKKSKSKSKGIGGGSVRKKKLSGPPCVGLYVDALVRIECLPIAWILMSLSNVCMCVKGSQLVMMDGDRTRRCFGPRHRSSSASSRSRRSRCTSSAGTRAGTSGPTR